MKKIFLLIGTTVLVLGVLYGLFILVRGWFGQTETPSQPTPTLPVALPGTGPGAEILRIHTTSGEIIPVRDFRSDDFVETIADGVYILRDTDSTDTASFSITYTTNDGAFVVVLKREPLGNARIAAEEAIMRHVGVPRDTLCSLPIFVGVARDVNEFYAGQELGVSSCPGSQEL